MVKACSVLGMMVGMIIVAIAAAVLVMMIIVHIGVETM